MKSKNPNLPQELFLPIIDNIKNKNFDEALILLNNISNQDPNIINRLKGSIYLNKRDWPNSLLFYEKISDKEKNFKILNNIGYALLKIGKFSEASIKFKEAINNNNSFITAYENLSISYKLVGNYKLSIKYLLEAIKLMPENQKLKNYLIDLFNYYEPNYLKNSIIKLNHQISEVGTIKKNDKKLQNINISNLFIKSEEILQKKFISFNYPETQIYRRNKHNLNCDRHFGIFNKYKIIPKFCFSCYKVQITIKNVLNLIKLYFYFNNLVLEKNNIRKTMIELREKVSGNYKGYLYANSISEADNIKNIITKDLTNNEIDFEKIEIKHGCTEYYEEYELYKNINEDVTNQIYKKDWINLENEFDQKNWIEENSKERSYNNTLNKFNLPDFLIIKNWLIYAKIIDDQSYKKVFDIDVKTTHLSKTDIQKIQLRAKKN